MKTLIVGISVDIYTREEVLDMNPERFYEEAKHYIKDGEADIWTLRDFMWMCNTEDVLPCYFFKHVMVEDDEADQWVK